MIILNLKILHLISLELKCLIATSHIPIFETIQSNYFYSNYKTVYIDPIISFYYYFF